MSRWTAIDRLHLLFRFGRFKITLSLETQKDQMAARSEGMNLAITYCYARTLRTCADTDSRAAFLSLAGRWAASGDESSLQRVDLQRNGIGVLQGDARRLAVLGGAKEGAEPPVIN